MAQTDIRLEAPQVKLEPFRKKLLKKKQFPIEADPPRRMFALPPVFALFFYISHYQGICCVAHRTHKYIKIEYTSTCGILLES